VLVVTDELNMAAFVFLIVLITLGIFASYCTGKFNNISFFVFSTAADTMWQCITL